MAGQAIRAGRAFSEVFADTAPLARGLKRVSAKLKRLGTNIRGFGQRLGLALVVPGIGMVKLISAFARFEKTMSRVKALTQATSTEFDILRTRAKELGRTTVFTASQVADAMSDFALGGLSVAQILDAIAPAPNLSAAAQLDVAEASEIAVKAMNAMGLQATDMGRIVDVLTGGFTNATTTLVQLGDALKFIGPIAFQAGLSLEETVAAIALLSSSGEQASKAGTGLRGIIARLTNPTAEATATLAKLGVEVNDTFGNVRPFAAIIGDLQDSLEGLGSGVRLATLGQIFPNRQLGAAAILIGKGEKSLRQFTKMLEESGGLAERVAATQLNNLTGSFTLLTSAIEGLAIQLGEALVGPLRVVVSAITQIVRSAAKWAIVNKTIILGVSLMFVALVGLAVTLVATGVLLQVIAFAIGGFVAAFGFAASAVAFMVSPLGLVIASLATVGFSLLTAGKNMDSFGGIVKRVIAFIGGGFSVLRKDVETAMGGIADALSGGDMETATEILVVTLKLIWRKGMDFIIDEWNALMNAVIDLALDGWQTLVVGLQIVWDGMVDTFTKITNALAGLWDRFVTSVQNSRTRLTGFFTKFFNKLASIGNDVFTVEDANEANLLVTDQVEEDTLLNRIDDKNKSEARERALAKQREVSEKKLNSLVSRMNADRAKSEDARIAKQKRARITAEKELALLIERRQTALDKATEVRKESDARIEIEKVKERNKDKEGALGGGKDVSSLGTFNAAALLSLEGTRTDDRIEKNTRNTARGVSELKREIRKNRAEFA